MIDYIMLIIYRNFNDCKDAIDKVTIKNKDVFKMNKTFNDIYDENKYNDLIKGKLFKLTYKKKYDMEDKDGNLTNYCYFMKKD